MSHVLCLCRHEQRRHGKKDGMCHGVSIEPRRLGWKCHCLRFTEAPFGAQQLTLPLPGRDADAIRLDA